MDLYKNLFLSKKYIIIVILLFSPLFALTQIKYIIDSPLSDKVHRDLLIIPKMKELGLLSKEDFDKKLKVHINSLDSALKIKVDPALLYEKGRCYYLMEQYHISLVNFTKATRLEPKLFIGFQGKADSKKALNDNYGAIIDYTEAIDLIITSTDTKYKFDGELILDELYFKRGQSYLATNNYIDAELDFNYAIETVDKENLYMLGFYHFLRGVTRTALKKKISGCEDLSVALELGEARALEYINDFCQ